MHLCLFEDERVRHLEPLVLTRPVCGLRVGMRTLVEAARDAFGGAEALLHTRPYLAAVAAQEHDALVNRIPDGLDVLFLNARYVPEPGDVLRRLRAATKDAGGRVFVQGDDVVAAWVPGASSKFVRGDAVTVETFEGLPEERVEGATLVGRLWDLVTLLRPSLVRDYAALAQGLQAYRAPNADVHPSAIVEHEEAVYVGAHATVRPGAIISAADGPVYLGEHATIHEAAVLKGPLYVGAHAQVKAQAHVEGSAFGPWVKVAGEVHDATIHSYANKSHPGFLGHAYLGRWCNLGADTNTSNLKNDYGPVSMYDAVAGDFVRTDRQFLGLIMGDHSKCGINTMFNTGTVVGVNCNLYGAGFLPRYVPSFSWGGADGLATYRLDKALRVAEAVMARRDVPLTDADREMLTEVFRMTNDE